MVSFLLFTDLTTTPLYCSDQIKCTLISLTTHIAAFSTAWSLLGSPQNGQAVLYLFQIHLLHWEYIQTISHCGHFETYRSWCCVCMCVCAAWLVSLPLLHLPVTLSLLSILVKDKGDWTSKSLFYHHMGRKCDCSLYLLMYVHKSSFYSRQL